MLLLLSKTATEHINKLLLSPMITIKYFKIKSRDAIKLMDSRKNIKLQDVTVWKAISWLCEPSEYQMDFHYQEIWILLDPILTLK